MANSSIDSKTLSSNDQSDSLNCGELINGYLSPLQKHAAFFDRNQDGLVYPWETFQGFRAIGSGIPLSTIAAIFINCFLSSQTRPGKLPSLLFPIEIKNIKRAKHGSDTGVYDTEGRFVPEKFEEIFSKHAHVNPNALTSKEVSEMLKANRVSQDFRGWIGAWTEWKVLYYLCKDKDGFLHKDTIRGVYDGTLFEQMEEEHRSSRKTK
ncbi:PREDICTED: probable peroxygenase 4 [Nelumbo nucifera]|uniref:Probable peroxygenase 4 n=1 Tax=Nelumbo nucifera TaxID=4432 RepID=A0A1U8AUW6_NELNU|nr:PREDICTED: probable peroxygenase 4 [Nelumbo nucifera]